MSEEDYDLIIKLVLIGDSGVGKSNILTKYTKNEFHQNSRATVGVEFSTKKYTIDKVNIKAQIWDTAGQERYRSITTAYYKGAKGAFVVYDITRAASFENVDRWIRELRNCSDENVNITLIGNKSDLVDYREIKKEQGEEKARSYSNFVLIRNCFY
jgi:Ras-related protein Rab-11A